MTQFGYLLPSRGAVMTAESTADLTTQLSTVVDLGREAEQLGYDSVWIGDSVLARPRPEPLITLAALATATETVGLGTAVYLPNLRHPVNVAHQTSTLDQLSGGRFELGVGVGSAGPLGEHEHDQLNVPFDQRGAILDEALAVISDLWSEGSTDFDGTFHHVADADLGFQPRRRPPVYVASSFDPRRGFPQRVLRRVAKHGQGWFPTGITPEMYAAGIERVRHAFATEGRDPDDVEALYYLDAVVADDERAALEAARKFKSQYYPDWEGTDEQIDEMRSRGAYGSPRQVCDRIEAFREAGVERFVVRFVTDEQREQLRRFAADVVE